METNIKEIKSIFRNIFRDIKSIIEIREENKRKSKQETRTQSNIQSKYNNVHILLSNLNTKINLIHAYYKHEKSQQSLSTGGTKISIKKSFDNIIVFYDKYIKNYKLDSHIYIFIEYVLTLKNKLYSFTLGILVPDLVKRNLLGFGEYSVNEQLSLEPDIKYSSILSSSSKKTSHK